MSPKTDTYPEHQICRSPGASLSELRGAGHFKPLLLKFLRNAHETGAFAGVRLVPIFIGTLSPLFLLGLCLGTGRRSRVWLPTRGLRVRNLYSDFNTVCLLFLSCCLLLL